MGNFLKKQFKFIPYNDKHNMEHIFFLNLELFHKPYNNIGTYSRYVGTNIKVYQNKYL